MEAWMKQLADAGIALRTKEALSSRSTFRIGGEAEAAIFPRSVEELCRSLRILKELRIPVTVVGKGSNVVFPDETLAGAVIFTEGLSAMRIEGNVLRAEAGVTLAALAKAAMEASLSGSECLGGIPGSVGGAVMMNAGAYGACISDICLSSRYYDFESGEILTLTGDAQGFGVRTSAYQEKPGCVILEAELRLEPGDRARIGARMQELAEKRRASQPLEWPSAGSVFKRPEGHFAGKLIEDCGLKGLRVGGAEVSEKHAGFIINRGGARARDVRELVERIRETVRERTGVTLECEIKFL